MLLAVLLIASTAKHNVFLLFALMQKVTKRSRLQKNRLKFIALRYSEKAKARLYTVNRPNPKSASVNKSSFSLLNASFHKFLNAVFLRPQNHSTVYTVKKRTLKGWFSLKIVLEKKELYASHCCSRLHKQAFTASAAVAWNKAWFSNEFLPALTAQLV